MEKFTEHTGPALPLRRSNVDTDQIIPAVYLKRVTRTGFEDGLFAAWRGVPDFVMNRPAHAGASILLAGPDFGTGSSREHAVWALQDAGFKVVVSSRFADIFRGNSLKGGLLTAQVEAADSERLFAVVETDPSTAVTVDLVTRTIRAGDVVVPFAVDDYARWRLLEGLDDIGLTMRHIEAVDEFERSRPGWLPRTLPVA
ncbi:MAG: 3-isopropylmalate dehydratase small subunit [Actinomycetota bacterium]|nr:3-isopropylmalate dehydratase small subunit [Actinomycetota bacterium]